MRVIAIFGPTGVGKTEVAIALADRLRADGEDPVAVSADAMQVYDGLPILTGAATPEQQGRLEHRLLGVVPVTEPFSAGAYTALAHAEIDGALAAGRRPLVVGGTGLYLRAALAQLDLRPPAPAARARRQAQLTAFGPEALHAELAQLSPAVAAGIGPSDGRRIVRALELLDSGIEPPPSAGGDSQLWMTDTRHPTLLAGLVMEREALRERIDRRADAMVAAGRRRGGPARQRAGRVEHRPQGARLRGAARRRPRGDEDPHAPVRPAAADLDAQAPVDPADRRHRPRGGGRRRRAARHHPRAMKFEKWQALGNDYLILEAAGVDPEEVRSLCDRHLGVGADGVLALAPADEPGYVARLRIYNPDGSEAELSGNGARQALLYLREHGWTESDTYSIQTVAGEIRTTITGERSCRTDMGRAIVRFDGEIGGMRFQHLTIGNPQTPIRIADREELEALDLAKLGPLIENHDAFPNRTNVSFWTELAPDRIRARIFERGVGETMSSGTGASGAAVAHVLRGGDSPVTVVLDGGELEVDVDESLHVDLTGWAIPVFRGELS